MSWRRQWRLRLLLIAGGVAFALSMAIFAMRLTGYMPRSYLQRHQWMLSATEDQWSRTRIQVTDCYLIIENRHTTAPAFVGNYIAEDAPFSNNRTRPQGVQWTRVRMSDPRLEGIPAVAGWWGSWWNPNVPPDWWIITVNLWLIGVVSAVVSGCCLIQFVRGWLPVHRLSKGLCPSCAYDVRATPQTCPECGATLAAYK